MKLRQRIVHSVIGLAIVAALAAPGAALAAKAKVDINTASQAELEALPGIGEATAKKIVAGRPYSSVGELSRAGVSAATIEKISGQVKAGRSSASAPPAASAASSKSSPSASSSERGVGSTSRSAAPAGASGSVDLNTASQKELEDLPGVGAATAKKIIAGRPYSSVGDLSRAGVSASTIQKISSSVTVSSPRASSSAPASSPASGSSPAGRGSSGPSSPARGESTAASVDLNSASQKDLEALPGVGAVTAKKIIGGRPYSSVADLSRAGVSSATIAKISPMVTVSSGRGGTSAPVPPGAPASSSSGAGNPAASAPAAPASTGASSSSSKGSSAPAQYQPPPSPGMVWVNLETKVFHRQGDTWYGKTKKGKYMTEADAVKAGYRLSKEKDEPK